MDKSVKQIVIVGGGSAGWLTAGIIAAAHNTHLPNGINITLIESSDIPTIGVGEGTWPTMRDTLHSIGISEQAFIACCDASFKQGSFFVNWCHDTEQDSYYHPFVAPHGFGQSDLVSYWQQNQQQTSFAHALSCQPHLCDNFKAPKQLQTPQYAAVANYGYHLNAGKFATLLKEHCVNNLGVIHIDDKVNQVKGAIDNDIEAVITENHGEIKGDLFIDCSGQHALLIDKHYQIPLKSLKHILFNDSAIAVQVPYKKPDQAIASQTIATAHDNGWLWDIGLVNRRGVGCVYASDYCNTEQAKEELTQYLSKELTNEDIESLDFREISFTPGHREIFWHKNCVAVGMAAGFIEPLEASALALIELSAKMIAKELPSVMDVMPIAAKRFNQRFNYRWQRIVEFLKLHYVLSMRSSKYWQDNRASATVPEHLQELLALWQHQEPTYNDFIQIEEIFPAASYQYILYGMGFKTQHRATQRQYDNQLLSEKLFNENKQLTDKYLAGLPANRELINYLTSQYQQQKAG
ncbi:tryptophan 7-halogenase [Thalassotalea sp. M1531]|uniref:Tryptophan 7-halogenase n=1 Tax=Thalassotalea algicola TaxID=2716224 RepID=A0A7Y0LBI9_9GAMM|nr:tryptophan halogenase family protein [Thalassotalea algicola]NMP31513.1 tryptophan 7-halogenase [Thalassotalea algicola]